MKSDFPKKLLNDMNPNAAGEKGKGLAGVRIRIRRRKVQQCRVKRVEGGLGQGSRISPDLLDRLPATVEEERGRIWIRAA